MELTPEDLKKMSPEELMELQKQNCIFCHIVSGKVSSKKVYEDDKIIGILDINPANPGHVLLFPKEHFAIMPQIPEDIISHMFIISKKISHACLKVFQAQGTNIFVANGVAAGQKAQHFMLHIIPRKEDDDLKSFDMPEGEVSNEQLEELRKKIAGGATQPSQEQAKEEVKEEPPQEKQEPEPEQEEKSEEKLEDAVGGSDQKEEEKEEEQVPEEKESSNIEKDEKGELNLDDLSNFLG